MTHFVPPAEYHEEQIKLHGVDSPEAVVWPDHGFQFLLISELLKHITLTDWCSILDAGCGRMDLLAYLRERIKIARYVGVDACEPLLNEGKRRFPAADCWLGDVNDWPGNEPFDFVLSSGMISYGLIAGDPHDWMYDRVYKMFSLCRKATVVNFNSRGMIDRTGADPTHWYLPHPETMLKMAGDFTDRYVLDHSPRHGFATLTLLRG